MQKRVLIIGGSSGLGKKLAELFAADGWKVGIIARRDQLLKDIAAQFPGNVFVRAADIRNESIEADINEVIQAMQGMDMLILAASIVEINKDLQVAPELNTVQTNVYGFTRVINIAWKYFMKNGGGQIVAITSIAAARGNKQATAYNASKSFQSVYLEGLRLKAKNERNNISITELVPGYMDTAMGKGDRMFWIATVEKAARQSKKAILKKRRKAFITKRWWWVYHILRNLPSFIYERIINGSWKLKSRT
jgi:short-subunit dehydrogenase